MRNPPSLEPDWKFESPRESKVVISQHKNTHTIIGRVYFVRGNPPSFIDELVKLNPFKESRNLVYDAIAGSALLTGILAWLLSEMFYYRSRKADRLEIESERALRDAAEQVTQANIDKFNAEKDARLAQSKTDTIAKEKDKVQEDARLAQAKAAEIARRLDAIAKEKDKAQEDARLAQAKAAEIAGRLDAIAEEKDRVQEDARLAQAKTDEIAQAKDKAQKDARIAQAKADETNRRLDNVTKEKLKADRNAEYLRKSINTKNTSYKELEKENKKLETRIKELEAFKIDGNLITEITTVDCSNVCEALMVAGEKFTILNIWDNAHRTAHDVNDSSPRRVYTVLEILAKVGEHHFQQITNNGIVYLLNEKGVRCSRESRATMDKFGDERIFHHRGEPTRQMEMHIKIGQQLRIYFDIDMENQKIIIGYCGRHLRTVTG